MKLLLLDAGNSRLKWGLWTPDGWLDQGAVAYDALGDMLHALPAGEPSLPVFGANVAGEGVASAIESALAGRAQPPIWLASRAEAAGVRNGYDRPGQLGVDRWAALVGARSLHAAPCLVVTAGTATTVDVLDGAGGFLGGLILPGVELMRRALATNTAGLGYTPGQVATLPRNTSDAIHAGCVYAQVGAVERMFESLAGQAGALCLLNGGAAEVLAAHLRIPFRVIPNLVLEGVACLAREQAVLGLTP